MASHKLLPARLQVADHYRSRFGVVSEEGATVDDFLRPDYWAHVANKLRRHDIIEIIPEDGSFFVELLVLNTGTGFAKVMLLREVQLESEADEPLPSDIEVKWRGPHRKFSVIRKSDNEVLKDSFVERTGAEQWAREYERAVAA